MVCSYHGWTFNPEGKLVGVPFYDDAYLGALDREKWGLVEVPKVQSYGGLIFGCWDDDAISLQDYLGGSAGSSTTCCHRLQVRNLGRLVDVTLWWTL